MSIASEYAAFCAGLSYNDLPDEVVAYAKRLTVDTTGIMIGAARHARSSEPILRAVRALNRDATGATILATGEPAAPEYAAFANGSMAHSLDYDDTHRAASLHPGAPVIAAALASAEETNATGETLLTSIVAGYEVVCRLGMAVNAASHYARGFHGTGTCGVFGATAAAGTIHDLTPDELEAAFGINGSQPSGSLQFLANGAWNKRIHPGIAAHNGLIAVALAKQGFVGASEPILGERGFLTGYTDEPEPALATRGLGTDYETTKTGMKPYPCCRYMHGALDLLLELATTEDIQPEAVEEVAIHVPTPGIGIIQTDPGEYPASFVDAQFSMRYGTALALTQRDAGITAFTEPVQQPYPETFKRIHDATRMEPADDIDAAYPDAWPARVIVDTDRDRFEREVDHALGEPENPMTDADVTAKYTELVEHLPASARDDLLERLRSLETYSARDLLIPITEPVGTRADD